MESTLCFPDPEIEKLRIEKEKHTTFIKHLEAKLTKAQKTIEMLENTKRKLHEEIGERVEKRKKLQEQAMERGGVLQEKWKSLARRYGFSLDSPFSLLTLLPPELLTHVISFISIEDILLSLSSVSKTFHDIIYHNSLWNNLYHIRWKKLKTNQLGAMKTADKDWHSLFIQRYRLESNWQKGKFKMSTIDHGTVVSCLSMDGDVLATGSPDKCVRIWSLGESKMPHQLTAVLAGPSYGGIECLQINASKNMLVSGSRDGVIKVWDFRKQQVVASLDMPASVSCIQFEDANLVAGYGDGTIKVWDMHTGVCVSNLLGHSKFVTSLQFNGKQLISGSRDRTIKMWDLGSNHPLCNSIQTNMPVEKVQWKGDLLLSTDDNMLVSWSLGTNSRIKEYSGHTHWVKTFQFKKNMLVSSSEDNTIKVWDLAQASVTSSIFKGHHTIATCLQFDDHRLVSGLSDRSIRIYDFM